MSNYTTVQGLKKIYFKAYGLKQNNKQRIYEFLPVFQFFNLFRIYSACANHSHSAEVLLLMEKIDGEYFVYWHKPSFSLGADISCFLSVCPPSLIFTTSFNRDSFGPILMAFQSSTQDKCSLTTSLSCFLYGLCIFINWNYCFGIPE